eukprot:scaffold18079_cov65-Phaeocystis_antarctica.AAC.15
MLVRDCGRDPDRRRNSASSATGSQDSGTHARGSGQRTADSAQRTAHSGLRPLAALRPRVAARVPRAWLAILPMAWHPYCGAQWLSTRAPLVQRAPRPRAATPRPRCAARRVATARRRGGAPRLTRRAASAGDP